MCLTIRCLIIAMMLAASQVASALDASDTGTYAVVQDDRITDILYFVSYVGTEWNIQSKISVGTWTDITCKRPCSYSRSKEADIAQFFPESGFQEVAAFSCIDNTEFAFCELTSLADRRDRFFMIRALGLPESVPFLVKKVANERLSP